MASRKIFCFDVETTGLAKDSRVVQIAYIVFILTDDDTIEHISENQTLVNPCISIPKEASDVHHIDDAMVANAPTFAQIAKSLCEKINECDAILTYNGNAFDVTILHNEFKRTNIPSPFLDSQKGYIDAYGIEKVFCRLTLSDTYKRCTGRDMENAHDAMADVRATVEVFGHQVQKMVETDLVAECTKSSEMNKYPNIVKDANGVTCLNIGKHKGKSIDWVRTNDAGYFRWFKEKILPSLTIFEIAIYE